MDPKRTPADAPNADIDAVDVEAVDIETNELDTLTGQLAEAENNLASMRETVLRERADLDNQRKRMQRDLDMARKFANEKLLADLLPVVDNLERGLAVETADAKSLRGGVELTLRELVRVVEAGGLKAVGKPGEVFNPDQHQAMQMIADSGQPAHTIVSVFQKGYMLNERLLRPALVTVAES
ncbi:MAG: nucleotide exchange factor GrpE [Dokdonella sp.]